VRPPRPVAAQADREGRLGVSVAWDVDAQREGGQMRDNRTRTRAKIARKLKRAIMRGSTFICGRCGRERPMLTDDKSMGGIRFCSTTCAENDRHAIHRVP